MEMASIDLSSSTLRTSRKVGTGFFPCRTKLPLYRSVCESSTSTSAANSTLVCEVHAPIWLAPRPPLPTTATRTVLLGLFWLRRAPEVTTAAVLMKKYLRFISLFLQAKEFWPLERIIQPWGLLAAQACAVGRALLFRSDDSEPEA